MHTIRTYHDYRADLKSCPLEATLDTPLSHQDAQADVFRVNLRRGMLPIDLTDAQAFGYLYLASTKQTIPLTGETAGSTASVLLSEGCYATPGPFSLVIQAVCGDVRHTVLRVNGEIEASIGGEVIDPAGILPDLPALLAEIERLRAATEEARRVSDQAQEAIAETAQQTLDALARAEAAVHRAAQLTAPAIIDRLEGDLPVTFDAADNRPLMGLRIFGQSRLSSQPAHSAPATISSLGEGGGITLRTCAHNLFPGGDPEQVVFTGSDRARQTRWGYAIRLPEGFYNLRAIARTGASQRSVIAVLNSADGAFQAEYTIVNGLETGFASFEAAASDILYLLGDSNADASQTAAAFADYRMQLLTGSVAVSGDQPIVGSRAALSTPGGLRAIPAADRYTYSDYFGDAWITDEIDVERGVRIRRIGQIVLDGVTPGRMAASKSSTAKVNAYNVSTDTWGRRTGTDATLLISHYEYRGTAASSGLLAGDYAMICSTPGSMYIGHDSITTLADYNAWLAAQHAAGTPVTILYELETPVEEPLTEQELEAASAMCTVYPFTTLICDGAWVIADYIVDTKNYIDARFNELASQFILA